MRAAQRQRGMPFIRRELRPEPTSKEPAPPLLPASPSPATLKRCVTGVIGQDLCEALSVAVTLKPKLGRVSTFKAQVNVASADLDGETILLHLRTAESFTLNPAGALIWKLLTQGKALGDVWHRLQREFDVEPELAWADLTALVRELYRAKLLVSTGRWAGKTARPSRLLESCLDREDKAVTQPGLIGLQVLVLEKQGSGFLIAPAANWRRSQLSAALLRSGYRALSNGPLLLLKGNGGLELKAAALFAAKQAGRSSAEKRLNSCQLRFLLFPEKVDWPESSLEPLPRSRALEELLNLTLLLRGQRLSARQLRSLAQMVQGSGCYRLHCGEDISQVPVLLDGLDVGARP